MNKKQTEEMLDRIECLEELLLSVIDLTERVQMVALRYMIKEQADDEGYIPDEDIIRLAESLGVPEDNIDLMCLQSKGIC